MNDGCGQVGVTQQDLVERETVVAFRNSKASGRVALGIGVDEKNLRSLAAREAARLMAVVVLPTPPFWFAIAMIFPKPYSECST